jgi:uncharacterized protein YndB with AHSA1/START domain
MVGTAWLHHDGSGNGRPTGWYMDTRHARAGRHRLPNHSLFQEVVFPQRLVFKHGGSKAGGPEADFVGTWTFEVFEGSRTEVTIHMVFSSAAARDAVVREYGAIEGGKQTLERLAEHLPTMGFTAREIVLERTFDAPAELVFRCWTDPTLMARWWGPSGFTNPVCELNVRVGGTWRIVMRGADGTDYPCHGVYQEVVPAERLVFTNIATDAAGKPVLEGLTTVTFAEADGKTKMTVKTGAVALVGFAAGYLEGMEIGWAQSLDRLVVEAAAVRPVS